MNRKKLITIITSAAMATTLLGASTVAQAWNMGNMMNPGKWFDDDDDDYYRHRYYRGGYGYGPYGWGGPYGGWGGPYGWGGYPGYGGYGGYGAPSTIVVNPSDSSKSPPPPRLPE